MTTHYERGARFERETRDDLVARGYRVIRAAGSKGDTKADLVGFREDRIVVVQCKSGKKGLTLDEFNGLYDFALVGGAFPLIAQKIPGRSKPMYLHMVGRREPNRPGCTEPFEP